MFASFRCDLRVEVTGEYMKKRSPTTEKELAERFDAGEELEPLGFDPSTVTVEEPVIKRVNVDFPAHMLAMLDREAEIRGINRQALIKTWLYDRLMQSQTK
jgi:predicted nucleotide-binding protein (sugar kinase/HSP70/actin superfamily)